MPLPLPTTTTTTLWPATKENVREHLLSLGYQDVPESVLEEFVDDLNQLESEQKTIGSLLAQSERQHELEASFHRQLLPSPKKSSSATGAFPSSHNTSGGGATTAAPTGISREQILRQLEDMGYGANVPEAVLEELVQELNDAYEKEHPLSNNAGNSNNSNNKAPHYQRPLNKKSTLGATTTTTTTGYGDRRGVDLPPPLSSFGRSFGSGAGTSAARASAARAGAAGGGSAAAAFTKAKKDLDPLLQQLADLELSGVRAKVQRQQQQQQQQQQPLHLHPATIRDDIHGYLLHGKSGAAMMTMDDSSGYFQVPSGAREGQLRRTQSAPVKLPVLVGTTRKKTTTTRKNDPVNLYHQFHNEWKKDQFLTRLENPASAKAKQRMFGGVGYHAAMGGSVVERR